jgi:hypothetical protein
MTLDEQIDEIMDNFDFRRVHEMMKAVNWTWGDDGVPEEPELRTHARQLLREIAHQEFYSSSGSGGFEAFKRKDGGEWLELRWGQSWEVSTDTKGNEA